MIMYLLDKQQNIIQAISDGIIEAKLTEEINTADKLSFSLVQNKRLASSIYFVCIPATRGSAFLMFKIISESVKDDRIEYTCIESAYDELKSYAYIKDVRPQDKTASEMLQIALAGTRWEVGYSEETVRKQTNFYYISTLEAIQKVVELFKIELTFTVVIDPITNRIVRRQVNLYSQQGERTGKRFEYGSNLLSVTREESSEDLVTALVGRGKGEQLDDGDPDTPDGYGRRIMFTDVIWSKANGNPTDKPAGQDYVEDKEATKLYGFDDGKPRIGIAVFEDIEDVNQLINATWAALQVAKRPKVSFKASALDIGDLGLGDTVAIIRHELNIEYFTRVYKVEHDLLDKNNNVIELGDDFSEKSLTNYVASVKEAQEETSRVANIALTSANGKNKNFYSNVKPTIASEGDNLFLDLGNGETEYYVWKNGNWELILSTAELNTTKKEVDKALSDIEDVRSQADQAFNNAKNAQYSADSVYRSFMDLQKNSATQDTVDYYYKELADSISAKYNQVHNEIQSSFDGLMPVINDAINNATDAKKQLNNALSEVGRIDYSMKALQSSYANLNGEISQTKQTANQISTKLANTQGDITKLVTKAGKLEQQLLSKVDTTLFENFREATSRELKQRLTATDLNGYVKSTELVQTANGIRASVSAVDGKLNDLKIGGANLIPNSNASETGAVAWTGTRLFTHPFYFNGTKNMFNVDNSTTLITAAVSQRFAIKPNTQYTLSYVGFMSTNSGGYNIFLRGRKGNVAKESQFIQGGRLSASSTEYKHVTFTTGDIDNAELAFNVDGSTNGNVSNFFFNEVMLVEGNKDLRWGPAPKDVENRYASLNIEVDKINAVVANKADMSYVNQKADQWQLALTNLSVGGTNLLGGTSTEARSNDAPTSGWVEGAVYNTTQSLNEKQYVLSFEARGDVNGQRIGTFIWHGGLGGRNISKKSKTSLGETFNAVDGQTFVTLTNQWKRYWVLYDVDPDNTKKTAIVGRRWVDSRPSGKVYVRKVKLEAGNKATSWSPAPEDDMAAITAVKNELNTAINLRVQKNELLSQINLQAGHTLIQSKKIYLDAETVAFSGKAFIPNAAIVDLRADKITAGTLNASKVSIINLDVNRLTGNKTEFVKSFWRSAYGNYVNIDYSGMRVTYGNTTTEFNSHGMEITAVGESIGGIGWQGMKNMPPNYQGLLFWLDGGGDYMAWAARNNGNYNMNPLIKLSWYRKEWTPPNSNAGFNFDDTVTFNDIVYPSGNPSDGMALRFFTTQHNGHIYPTIGSASMKAGIMFGDWDLFFLVNNKVYPLDGMKIPREINSDGTVNKWSSVNY